MRVVSFGSIKEFTMFPQPYFLKGGNVHGPQFHPLYTFLSLKRCKENEWGEKIRGKMSGYELVVATFLGRSWLPE
jgi:hypothetical protein